MSLCEISFSEKLRQLVDQYADDRGFLKALRFLGVHPDVWFSQLAVVRALKLCCGIPNPERVLKMLVDRGAVKITTKNNELLYSLSDDAPLRCQVLELAMLDWYQILFILNRPRLTAEAKGHPVPCLN